MVEYRVLGPLEAERDEAVLPLGRPMQRALLALLLLNANRVVPRDRLIDLLWEEQPPTTVVTNLQGLVSRLRKLLPADVLQTHPSGYLLQVDVEQLDSWRFERFLARARESDPEHASRLLRDALALWRGPALAEFAQSFARAEAARLESLRLSAVEDRIEADLALGRHSELIAELEVLIAEQPQHEGLRAQLMLALYRAGRQPDALTAYREARAALGELGLEPGERLRELERQILNQDAAIALSPRRSNLPREPTELIGRSRELDDVLELVRSNDMVTLTGAGGSGKTRLAVRAAHTLVGEFADGVWFVPLGSVDDPTSVESAIAQAVGAHGDLNAYLRNKRLLLVLDNLEQLLPDVAATVARLEANVLATSRERIRIRGEQEYPVPPLAIEDAVELFVQRARQVEPSFRPDDHVSGIARRLDGLPLALELAAARVKALTPRQIDERLGHGLALLAGGARDLPDRHRTLRATIEWSYQLLDEHEAKLFARLAVFGGGSTLDAAEQVADAQLDVLQSLVDKSLVRHSGERFWMLETIRELAVEKLALLDDVDRLRRRHAEYLLGFFRDLQTAHLDGERFARAKAESFNLPSVVEWALETEQADIALALASTERLFVSPRRRARWLDAGLRFGNRVDPALYADALRVSAGNYSFLGDFDRAESLAQQSLAAFRALGDRGGEIQSMHLIGLAVGRRGEHDRARELLEEALRLADEGTSERPYAVLHSLGDLEFQVGNVDRAAGHLEQALQLALSSGDVYEAGLIEHSLGDVALARGDLTTAERRYLDALRRASDLDHLPTVAYCLAGLACVSALRADAPRAGRLWGASETFQRAADFELLEHDRRRYETALAASAGRDFERAAESTRTRQPDQALAAALAEDGVGASPEEGVGAPGIEPSAPR